MILVTGGLGFIGPHAARALLDSGESCVLTRRRSSQVPDIIARHVGQRVLIESLDLADREALLKVGRRNKITGIVHLAAEGFLGSGPLEYVKASTEVLFNVLDAAERWEVNRVCLASTIGIYAGAIRPGAVHEDTPVPLAATAALSIPTAKRSAELLAGFVGAHAEFEVINIRFSAVWGPLGRDRSSFFIAPALIHAAARGAPLELSERQHGRFAEDTSDLCYVKDCARAIALLQTAEKLNHTTYNIGCGQMTSNTELLAAIHKLVPDATLPLPDGRDPNGPDQASWLDISRIHGDTGYQPEYLPERAVADYVAWLRAGNDR